MTETLEAVNPPSPQKGEAAGETLDAFSGTTDGDGVIGESVMTGGSQAGGVVVIGPGLQCAVGEVNDRRIGDVAGVCSLLDLFNALGVCGEDGDGNGRDPGMNGVAPVGEVWADQAVAVQVSEGEGHDGRRVGGQAGRQGVVDHDGEFECRLSHWAWLSFCCWMGCWSRRML